MIILKIDKYELIKVSQEFDGRYVVISGNEFLEIREEGERLEVRQQTICDIEDTELLKNVAGFEIFDFIVTQDESVQVRIDTRGHYIRQLVISKIKLFQFWETGKVREACEFISTKIDLHNVLTICETIFHSVNKIVREVEENEF